MEVLFVCTGNICRSPVAEALFRRALEARGCEAIISKSAGSWAADGLPATSEAVVAAADLGADVSNHRARHLRRDHLEDADLVVVMTSVHRSEVVKMAPSEAHKVFLVKELAEMEPELDPSSEPAERLAALLAAQRPPFRRALDVDDPMGLPLGAYERAAREISAGVERLSDILCGSKHPV